MAYRSSGADNDGMVSNLMRFGVISSSTVEEGFRHVDRRFFVPKSHLRMAHSDQPLKEDNIHISAPHIYGAVMEALELPINSPLSFLNAGSGTGYLTCIAASILGPKSSHYCVEIHADAIEHCKHAIESWKQECVAAQSIEHINLIHGNALNLEVEVGECALGFDRIYIGADIDCLQLPMFKRLLKPGGILVGPVDGDLLKVVRLVTPLYNHAAEPREYTEESLSPVRFAPLVSHPRIATMIPARVWTPLLHQLYPSSFQRSCKALLLCSHSNHVQPIKPQPKQQVNAAAMLPRALWLEILSYTRRDWFEAPQTEIEFLRGRLKEEQINAERAKIASLEANLRCHHAERERDMYRRLALLWKERIRNSSHHSRLAELDEASFDTVANFMLLSRSSVGGIEDLLQTSQDQSATLAGSDDGDESYEGFNDAGETNRMDEDEDMEDYDEDDDSSDSVNIEHHRTSASHCDVGSFSSLNALTVERQVRTISITEVDM